MRALQFDYINHKGEHHTYKVLPIRTEFGSNKLQYQGTAHSESWNLIAFVIERSGEVKNNVRTFALMRMRNVQEVPIEAG